MALAQILAGLRDRLEQMMRNETAPFRAGIEASEARQVGVSRHGSVSRKDEP